MNTGTPIDIITPEMTLAAIAEVVQEVGSGYVYVNHNGQSPVWDDDIDTCVREVTCLYVHGTVRDEDGGLNYSNATPGCIVGKALYRLGFSLESMHKGNALMAASLLEKDGFEAVSSGGAKILRVAQQAQDTGHTYGFALERARLTMLKLTN